MTRGSIGNCRKATRSSSTTSDFSCAIWKTPARQLERLGFQVSQINVQTNADAQGALTPSGTSNRLARLRRGYLEILAATHDTPLADQLKAALARYQGIHLIALSHDDIPGQRTRLTAGGFRMQPVVTLAAARQDIARRAGTRVVGAASRARRHSRGARAVHQDP